MRAVEIAHWIMTSVGLETGPEHIFRAARRWGHVVRERTPGSYTGVSHEHTIWVTPGLDVDGRRSEVAAALVREVLRITGEHASDDVVWQVTQELLGEAVSGVYGLSSVTRLRLLRGAI